MYSTLWAAVESSDRGGSYQKESEKWRRRTVARKTRVADGLSADCEIHQGLRASPSETAEYLAQMAAELVTLARSARLERLILLLDFVRREAEAEAEAESSAA
jgi:hypothetical protein